MKNKFGFLSNISKSGFVRSVMTRVLAIFITVSIIITAVAFWSFTADVRRSILDGQQKKLAAAEHTISDRMDDITSIAYNIGQDSVFYMEAVEDDPQTGREMSEMLDRYLIGNDFIEHLAYSRTSEPDVIYTASGERSLSQFFENSFGMDKDTAAEYVSFINNESRTNLEVYGSGDGEYIAYLYPLPQLSAKPQAHVLAMIPVKKVKPLLENLYLNKRGEVIVFDAKNSKIYGIGNLDDEIDPADFLNGNETESEYKSPSGEKYVLQKAVSETNSWTYVLVMRQSDTLPGLANKQLGVIVFILLLLAAAIILMLISIINQFKPISNLAVQMADKGHGDDAGLGFVDERTLLSDKIATLKDDSEQKQKYETAFYEAEAASKEKSAFLSSMSHDIRTPMNAIIGMTAIARKHIGDEAYVDECLKKVQVSSDYLLDIINNVLDMSRIESGRIPIVEEPMMIPVLIDSIISLMASSVEEKSQTLTVDVCELSHYAVLGDSIHLVQVFVNILSNAVKFTPEGGKISLTVRQSDSADDMIGNYIFSVSDTGVGIPPEFIDHVFDAFTRANSPTTSRTEGTGLGMSIAKSLVELMGGTISCKSELGRGTDFTVTLPMKYTDESTALSMSKGSEKQHGNHSDGMKTTPKLSGKRILLVEDNDINREIASSIIAETEAEIVAACDGKEAVDAFANHPSGYFDLIFMDIQMPIMNGYEATAKIRSMGRADGASVPIFAMTANTFDADVRQVKEAGMNGHVGKPYNPQTLYDVLSRTFGSEQP